MTVVNEAAAFRKSAFGVLVSKATGTLASETKALFTVSGLVIVTSIAGKVTTAITVANSYKLQANPTTGTTKDLVAATDIGTTDTPAGSLLSFDGVAASSIQQGPGAAPSLMRPIWLDAGTIEHVSAGTDGAITWYITYVPVDDNATIVAA